MALVRCPNPSCRHSFEIPEGVVGRDAPCPRCEASFLMIPITQYSGVSVGSGRDAGSPPAYPRVFGRYQILKELGRGGMATVYLALDTPLDRRVALKIPHASSDDPQQYFERFQREARAAARFVHPHICPIHDVGQIEGTHYLAMAFIEGQTLAGLIRGIPQHPRQAAKMVRMLTLALVEAHSGGVVHRDLKPANVMVNTRGDLVVMDFGLARHLDLRDSQALTATGAMLGTPAYMSPEQVQPELHKIGKETDLYSLGVILFEMVTGRLPFPAPSLYLLYKQILETPAPDPSSFRSGIPPRINEICRKAMEKRPQDRFQSASEMLQALDQFLREPASGAFPILDPIPVRPDPVIKPRQPVAPPSRPSPPPPPPPPPPPGQWRPMAPDRRSAAPVRPPSRPVPVPAPPRPRPDPVQLGPSLVVDGLALERRQRAVRIGVVVVGLIVALILIGVVMSRPPAPEPVDAVLIRARKAFDTFDFPTALEGYNAVLVRDPRDARALAGRARTEVNLSFDDRAMEDATKAVESDPKLVEARIARAICFLNKGETDLAIDDCNEAIRLEPNNAMAHAYRGGGHAAKGDQVRAFADLNRATEIDPKNAYVFMLRAYQQAEKGDFEAAIKDDTEAIRLEPRFAVAFGNRGSSYNKLKQWDKAIADYNEAILLNPSRIPFYHGRAWAYLGQGDKEKYYANLTRVIEIQPEDEDGYLIRGDAYRRDDELTKALEDYDRAIKINGRNPVAFFVRADALSRRDRDADALRDYEFAIELRQELVRQKPNDRTLLSELAVTFATAANHTLKIKDAYNTRQFHKQAIEVTGRLAQLRPYHILDRMLLASRNIEFAQALDALGSSNQSESLSHYEIASDLGSSQATTVLANRLEKESSNKLNSADAVEKLRTRSKMQAVKKFPVSCRVEGEFQPRPIDIYFTEPRPGKGPIDDEVERLRVESQATIPPEMIESFAKLYAVSRDKEYPYADLMEEFFKTYNAEIDKQKAAVK